MPTRTSHRSTAAVVGLLLVVGAAGTVATSPSEAAPAAVLPSPSDGATSPPVEATPSGDPGADTTSTPTPTPSPSPTPTPSTSPDVDADAESAPTAIAVGDDTATVRAGNTVDLDVLSNDTPAGELTIESVARTDGPGGFTTDGAVVTYTSAVTAAGTAAAVYTVSDAGGETAEGRITVRLQPPLRSVSLSVPSPLVALRTHRITGSIRPRGLGRPTVELQRKRDGRWKRVGRTRARADGGYALKFRTNIPRQTRLRARATWPDGVVRVSGVRQRRVTVVADLRVSGPLTRAAVPWSWRAGCPVPPRGLRKIRINHVDYRGRVSRGAVVVRASATKAVGAVLRRAVVGRFPIKSINPADRYYDHGRRTPTGSDVAAMRAGNTSAFNCRSVTGNPYRISQHSYGNAIDINTIQNPYVTGSRVYPTAGRKYLNRSKYRKGMILRGGIVATAFRKRGWPWGARWSHPDYQHFSSNGG